MINFVKASMDYNLINFFKDVLLVSLNMLNNKEKSPVKIGSTTKNAIVYSKVKMLLVAN